MKVGMETERTPLRVLFLTPYFRPYLGGIERAIERLSFQLLDSQAIEAVGVLTTKYAFPRVPHPEWPDREQTEEGISIFRLKGFPRTSLPLYSVPLVWFSPAQVRHYLEEFNPHIVHFVGDGWFWGHFWSWSCRKGRARFVFTPSYHTLPKSRIWLKYINRFISQRVDDVVTLTHQEAEQVRRDYKVSDDQLSVIGWGASVMGRKTEAVDTVPGNDNDPLTILCVGRLSRHKGQAWLMDVYRQARSSFQRPTRLVLVGREEDAEEELRAQARAAGLEDEIVFAGEVDDEDLGNWYEESDVFALFSQYEAFGLVYFEAMLVGLPVLTHEVGANRELLTQGARVVPRFDKEAAVSELVRLVNDEEHRRQLSEEAQEYALKEFTWSVVADKYLAVYRGDEAGGS